MTTTVLDSANGNPVVLGASVSMRKIEAGMGVAYALTETANK